METRFRVQGIGCRSGVAVNVRGSDFWVRAKFVGLWFKVYRSGFRFQGPEFGV